MNANSHLPLPSPPAQKRILSENSVLTLPSNTTITITLPAFLIFHLRLRFYVKCLEFSLYL